MKVARVAEVRKLDQCAIEEFGIPEEILMENAGMAAYFVISEELGGVRDKRFTVFCGAGNNGGDGLVAARMIHSNGGDVKVLLMGKRDKMKGSARQNLDIISRMPLEIRELESAQSVRDITS
ncbi:MAG: NAD(P)H-hydrate epimerase, partial [Chloroflexota bacterium]|nr:NAD(P)H-hydrate epimerase [Chloroflexota bacterium]